jgi:hypothetical protein
MTPEELEARIRAAGRAISLAGLVREAVAAEVLGCAVRTLRTWRYDGRAPAHIRLNGTHWYSVATLADFLTATAVADCGQTWPNVADSVLPVEPKAAQR